MIGKINVGGGGEGITPQGKVLAATAASAVAAGDFVKFVPGSLTKGSWSSAPGYGSDAGWACCALDDSRVFVLFGQSRAYAAIVTVDGVSSVWGTAVPVATGFTTYGISRQSIVLIDSNTVFVSYIVQSNSVAQILGQICTIANDNTITVGSAVTLVSDARPDYRRSYAIAAVPGWESTNIFLAYQDSSSNLASAIANVSGSTITVGNKYTLVADTNAARYLSVVVDNNTVYIAHSRGTYSHLYLAYGNTMDTTLDFIDDIALSTQDYAVAQGLAAVKVGKTIAVVHGYGSGNAYLFGCLVDISQTLNGSPVFVNDTQIYSGAFSIFNQYFSVEVIPGSKPMICVYFCFGYLPSGAVTYTYYIKQNFCTWDNCVMQSLTSPTVYTLQPPHGWQGPHVLATCTLGNFKSLICEASGGSSYVNSIATAAQIAKVTATTDAIAGIAKTNAAAAASCDIYVPNV